jgi:predicted signal transduction protein with EAL and GGDEF domain
MVTKFLAPRFDLDGFKDVNDTDGHSTGDHLLVEVAHRLNSAAGGAGRVYRLDGDEFVVVIPNLRRSAAGHNAGRVDVATARRALRDQRERAAHRRKLRHRDRAAGRLHGRRADRQCRSRPLQGEVRWRAYPPAVRAGTARPGRGLQVELRRAFSENEFELFFQPQTRLADDAVVGAEALLRWRHPQRGLVGPGAFIQTLAESSLASAVGGWIIRDARAKTAELRAKGLPLQRISVNLFPS